MKRYEIIILLSICLALTYLASIKIAEAYECQPSEETQQIQERLDSLTQGQTYIIDALNK